MRLELRGKTDERLRGGGCAGRYIAENYDRNRGDGGKGFEAINGRDQREEKRTRGNGNACSRADGAGVGIHGGGVQVHTTMQLCREEDAREEEGQDINI